MNNSEYDNFETIAPNAEHNNNQDQLCCQGETK